jgi:hypothetical protein
VDALRARSESDDGRAVSAAVADAVAKQGSAVRLRISSNRSAVRDVHRDLEAEAQVGEGGLGPLHGKFLLVVAVVAVVAQQKATAE